MGRLLAWITLGLGSLTFMFGLLGVLAPELNLSGWPNTVWTDASLVNIFIGIIAIIINSKPHNQIAIIGFVLGLLGFLIPLFYYGI